MEIDLASKSRPWAMATRPLLAQHYGAALIEANNVERVLTDIDANYGNCTLGLLEHGALLVFGAPSQLLTLVGQEHGRTIPLPEGDPSL